MVETKPSCPPEGKESNNFSKKKRDKNPIPRGTEVRIFGPNSKVQKSKPKLTSMVGALI